MLPFLKKKHQAGVIVETKERPTDQPKKHQEDQGLMACAYDLIAAVEAKDTQRVAAALKAAFQICETEPHEEGPHIEPHSYDAQNIKAVE